MLPRALIEEFWNRVSSIVQKRCHLTDERTQIAVMRFRNEIEPKVGDMIYHDKEDNVANTIIAAVKHGDYLDADRQGA